MVFRATGPEGARGHAQTLTASGKSVQKEVQQRERTITHIYDPRHHELAAKLGHSSDAPVVSIEVVAPSGAAGVLAARTTADKSALLKPLIRPLESILPSLDSIVACAAV